MKKSSTHTPSLSLDRRKLFELMLKEDGIKVSLKQSITRRGNYDRLPLSFAQQRLWFLDQLEPDSAAYNLSSPLVLAGPLNVAALEKSLSEIVRRHEVLRTVFINEDGQPFQVIKGWEPRALAVVDLVELPEGEREYKVKNLAGEEARRPFNLAEGPLFRVTLVRVREQEHVLLMTIHHIISDGWSIGILIKELGSLYRAYCEGEDSPLKELPIQYGDFAQWQREWLKGEELERQIAYWKQQLAGAPSVLELPTDRPRPMMQTFNGAVENLLLPRGLSDTIKELSRQEDVTLFITLLTTFYTLIYRYSGQLDINIGTMIANRGRSEIEGLIGLFANTLVLRLKLDPRASFRESISRVREVALGAYANQDLPFERLVEEIAPDRALSHTPLNQVMFILQNTPMESVALEGLSIRSIEVDTLAAKNDLILSVRDLDSGIFPTVEYNTDLFDRSTIVQMLGHFQSLLEAIVSDPCKQLRQLPLLNQSERRQLLVAFNQTDTGFDSEMGFHRIFEAQAAQTPDRVALVFEDHELSYRELNAHSNQLARFLRAKQVRAEQLVGLCVDRSIEMVVCVLGILKTGAAYLPMDPSYPKQRLAYMLEDGEVKVLITRQRLAGNLPDHNAQVVEIDSEWDHIAQEEQTDLDSHMDGRQLAYVIYTSGSTGRPKGVQIPHSALVNFLCSMKERPGLGESDVLMAVTTVSFDIAALEIMLPLTTGGRVVVASREVTRDAAALMSSMHSHQVTAMQATPSTWRMLVEAGWEGIQGLKILCGGESLGRELAAQLETRGAELWNLYGPTETTIWSTASKVENGNREVSIGKPIANTQIYLLDAENEPVPIGVVGELYIGGKGLANGYQNRAEMTAERFVPDPYSRRGGGRLYRTGDLARYDENGKIRYVGRGDEQVKVRGYRIETGEIEFELSQCEQVRQAAVVAVEDGKGSKKLVAFVVMEDHGTSNEREIRSRLKERLPEYMVPSRILGLDEMPMTDNGKVDRRALSRLERRDEKADEIEEVSSPIEGVLQAIWSQVLGRDVTQREENFFDLGGHSLLATQVMSRITEAFQISLAVRELFERPTVEELAARIEEARRAGDGIAAPPIVRARKDIHPRLSFAQQRLWFLNQYEPESPAYNMSVAIRLKGELVVAALESSLVEIERRHEALRTVFSSEGREPVQIVKEAEARELSSVDLTLLPTEVRSEEASRLASIEAQQPFDLEKGPLFRAKLLKLDHQEHVLLLTIHHIVCDAWAIGILIREIGTLYRAYSTGGESPLEELTIQYSDYAEWQRDWLRGDVLDKQIGYWKQELDGAPAVLQLPADRPRPPRQTFNGASKMKALPKELADSLKALNRREGTTLFMTLLAAFQVLLYRISGQQDFNVGTAIANRNRKEIEGLIGLFTNTLVLRARMKAEQSFRELQRRVRNVSLEAYQHQDLPFEQLVDAIQPERSLNHPPLYQVMFGLLNTPSMELELGDLSLELGAAETRTAKFDLVLNMAEYDLGLAANLEYNTDLYDEETITRLLGHFETLLRGIVDDPEKQLRALPLLSDDELQQILREWNGNGETFSNDLCIHQLFEAQADRTPASIAAVYEDQAISYRELNRRANQLANHLQAIGVGPDARVGICVERSLDLVVGLLAILKSGGGYLPLEPSIPSERLLFMLNDADVQVVLTLKRLRGLVSEHAEEVICIDSDWETLSRQSDRNPSVISNAENLAYMIYTSGSTGRPKGVLVSHQNVTRLLAATDQWFGFRQQDVWTLFHSFAFDFSVWELWGSLLYGGRLVVVPYWLTREPEAFYELLCREGVSVLNQTPSAFRQLIRAEKEGHLSSERLNLRVVIFGGEALDLQSLTPWFELHGECQPQLVNMYGITETTVHVTYRPLTVDDLTGNAGSVIGSPIPDLQVYLLDSYLNPVPVGSHGEINVGGAGIARGYLNKPELTAERFVPDPFSSTPGSRLYRSGDLARYLANGDIEYLGRIDHQVKIRGFRIELGEIESVLTKHPDVREAVVLAREDEVGDRRLVAYLVPVEGRPLPGDELWNYLKSELPEYMVPASFICIESFPLTVNGKVDRQLLPAPDASRPEFEGSYIAPRTADEEALAQIWAHVLGVDRVGINDNYFALGGDSIRSIQVRSLAEKQGLNLTLQDLFQYQTIQELAQVIKTTNAETVPTGQTPPFSLISNHDRLRLPDGLEDAYPLTRLQAGMLFHSELEPESAVYHNVVTYYLKAPFDLRAMMSTVQRLVERHTMLRTSFDLSSYSEPLQLVHKEVEAPLRVEDLSHLSNEDQERMLAEWLESEKKRPFDWTHPPLLRIQVHRRSESSFQLALAEHHAILDGWSAASLLTELFQLYFSILKGEETGQQRPLASSFRDFVALEREALESEEYRRFWEDWLDNSSITLLPRFHSVKPARQMRRIGTRNVAVSGETLERLNRFASSIDVPLKSALVAAHLRVLSVVTGQTDVLTGFASHGRIEKTDGERVIGLFLNILPLRMRLSGGAWKDLARSAFEAEQEMLPYRRYPLAELQNMNGGQPLFETLFNYLHFHVYQGLAGTHGLELLGGEEVTETNFTLVTNFSINPITSQLLLNLKYDATQLSEDQIEAIADYYSRALAAIGANPTGRYRSQSLLSEEEQRQIIVEWNLTKTPYPQDRCINQLFEEQVGRTPHAMAVVYEDARLTYGELNRRANRIARHLRLLGVGPDVLVGLCIERCAEMIVALLGILKAGGAYLPLDPTYPKERLAFMLEDAAAPVLLTQERLVERLPQAQAKVVLLDKDSEMIARHSECDLPCDAHAESLAYINYTSGSTGKPKGIGINHRAVNRLVMNCDYAQLEPGDVVAQASNSSFDAATFEIWGALLNGARLVGVGQELVLSPEEFALHINREGINVLFLTTALFNQMAREAPDAFLGMRHILFGGQAVEPRWVDEVLKRGYEGRLLHVYGPTESTTYSSWYLIEEVPPGTPTIPIGWPIANTQIYLLDADLQPVPVGTPGELCIGGDGLARGYLNRADLTAEKFIPDAFGDQEGARLYRSGDMARYRPDGSIEFLGRVDNQVKIRGFRVELEEIAVALSEHPGVREAVVLAEDDESGNKRMVAYVVPDPTNPPTIADLKFNLKEKLPDYMTPSVFVMLDGLPLTPNGKVDRRALSLMERTVVDFERDYEAPRTPLEEMLASIWSQVLGIERISAQDDFFDLGGHSLLATQVISRMRETFRVEFPLRRLFEFPTIAGLASRLEMALMEGQGLEEQAMTPVARDGDLPLSFAQQRLWFLNLLEPDSTFYNITTGVRLKGRLSVEAIEYSLSQIVSRHESLRTTVGVKDGKPVQIIAPPKPVRLSVIDISYMGEEEQEAAVRRMVDEETRKPFDLMRGPVYRTALLRLSADEHVMFLTMHHIVSDGWSMGVFIRELGTIYTAYLEGRPPSLPDLWIQYADFSAWQQQWLQGAALETQLSYWKQRLGDDLPVLELPTDRTRPGIQTFRGSHEPFALSPELSGAIKALTRQRGVTLFMTLLAAYKALLFRYSGQDDILVGSPIANRNRVEIEHLIGFFLNTLVLRTDLSDNPSFVELLARVREEALGAYAHQDLPFEKLVEELHPERDLSRHPLFQTMFFIQNAPISYLELPEVTLMPVEIEAGATKFDLSMIMHEKREEVNGAVEYSTDLFDRDTIVRFISHYNHLLEAAVADPDRPITELSLFSAAERNQLLVEWNNPAECRADLLIHRMFEQQAESDPLSTAVSYRGQEISYGELNRKSNQIAYGLVGLGVGPGQIAAIMIDSSPLQIAALLGVLKAGCVFFCIDPDYPATRLEQIFAVVHPSCLIADSDSLSANGETCSRLGQEAGVQFVNLDFQIGDKAAALDTVVDGRGWFDFPEVTNPYIEISPSDPAYIVFTSGSTGTPKGIIQSHRSFAQFIAWQSEYFEMKAPSRIAQWASIIYDASYCEIFGALCFGATLCMTSRNDRFDPSSLIEWVRDENITLLQVVPSFCRQILLTLDHDYKEADFPLHCLETLMLAGEVLSVELATKCLDRFSDSLKLYNLYGPSETILSTYYPVERTSLNRRSIPVGRAIDGREVLILDERNRLCPVGIRGEIYVRSRFLSMGYYQRPEETQKVFKQNPLHDDFPDPVYRTGDMGRWLADGTIEFLGRNDSQVKIRGMRVELGDIEATLLSYPSISECAVVAHDFGESDKRLAAYVVRDLHSEVSYDELRKFYSEGQHVAQYQTIYDEVYRRNQAYADYDAGLNLRIWISSYTGQQFLKEEIAENIDDVVNRIMSFSPSRVLEIGCGSGLLLFKIAPHCWHYCGTDISGEALRHLQNQLDAHEEKISDVRLHHTGADNFDDLETGSYDTVIINDVHIYFPSIEYFVRVLEGAVKATAPGGRIFIGGVRSLPLLRAFHTSVQLYKAQASLDREKLRQKIEKQIKLDKELVIDPAFFAALKSHLPEVGHVSIQLKRGRHHNEITRFQYDVVLTLGDAEGSNFRPEVEWMDCLREQPDLEATRLLLENESPDLICFKRIPNARLLGEIKAIEMLVCDDGPQTSGEIRGAIQSLYDHRAGLDPEDFWTLGDRLPYDVDISWPDSREDGTFDVAFRRRGSSLRLPLQPAAPETRLPWLHYANNPMHGEFELMLEASLRDFLKEHLPEHMVPSAFIFLDSLPKTRTNKIDRKSLPRPDSERPDLIRGYVAPRTEIESVIADVWQALLNVDRVGIHDNFFDLGGHSLLAAQAVNKLKDELSVSVPLRAFFEAPTVATLALRIEASRNTAEQESQKIARIIERVKNLSPERVQSLLAQKKVLSQQRNLQ